MATTTNGAGLEDQGAPADRTMAESIAERCIQAARDDDTLLYAYLLEQRKLARRAVEGALQHGTLGLSLWRHPDMTRGTVGYGGPAAAFLVRDRIAGRVVGVDLRYFEPEGNGGKKHCSKGETIGFPWTSDWARVERAKTVYVVDTPINALSIESCVLPPATAVLATRGLAHLERNDWSFLRGKSVVACLGNDPPAEKGPNLGYRPGQQAAWQLHEILTGLDISCMLVDVSTWHEGSEGDRREMRDPNELLQLLGDPVKVSARIKQLEEWAIPGVPAEETEGKSRIWFPTHDWLAYRKYRVQPDFTRTLKEEKDEEGHTTIRHADVCGFRVAAVSRVSIASPTSTMTGDPDQSPTTVFSVSVQTARHGAKLLRKVVDDEKLHNLDGWKKLGPIFSPAAFSRLVNVWERAAGIGARNAINFVGLAWRDGRPVVNEGPDCYFQDPQQQCPYSKLVFPGGSPADGAMVIRAYQSTFKQNAAAIPLVWALGGHLKAFLGFWPHFVMQAEKGSGKSTLIKRMERSLAFTMFSRQSMGTEFRMLTTISYTSHVVGWEEISAGKQEIIDKAVAQLQESYQYSHTRRGADMTDFLLCAPVLLAGEDVPVEGLTGKLVRCQLSKAKRGPLLPALPAFPMKQWLQYLAGMSRDDVLNVHREHLEYFSQNCVAASDAGAERMVTNYAAVATAWELLCNFTGVPIGSWSFLDDLVTEMNSHIVESTSERQPWALIVDKLLSEIASHQFKFPYVFDDVDEVPCLCVRTNFVMAHISQSNNLRPFWDRMTVKSDRVFKKQLWAAGVLLAEKSAPGEPLHVERTIRGDRVAHMVAINLKALEKFGLHATKPAASDEEGAAFFGSTSTSRRVSAETA